VLTARCWATGQVITDGNNNDPQRWRQDLHLRSVVRHRLERWSRVRGSRVDNEVERPSRPAGMLRSAVRRPGIPACSVDTGGARVPAASPVLHLRIRAQYHNLRPVRIGADRRNRRTSSGPSRACDQTSA
jgi:hypothetical protein